MSEAKPFPAICLGGPADGMVIALSGQATPAQRVVVRMPSPSTLQSTANASDRRISIHDLEYEATEDFSKGNQVLKYRRML